MELLRFATAGSVDDGKSTLIGRLLYDTKSIFQDQLDAVERASLRMGSAHVNLALLTDGLRAEREQGITIDVAYRYFATPKRKFIIADTPGHTQYTRNMVTGASTADLALVLVDARTGVVEQSRRHAFLSTLLRIPHLVVCVNKMDLVGYDEGAFDAVKAQFREFATKLEVTDVTFVPSTIYPDRLESMTDGLGTRTFLYEPATSDSHIDPYRRIEEQVQLTGATTPAYTVVHGYDSLKRRSKLTAQGSASDVVFDLLFDEIGRLKQLTNPLGSAITTFTGGRFDPLQVTGPVSGTKTDFGYDANRRFNLVKHSAGSSVLAQFDYTHQVNGTVDYWKRTWNPPSSSPVVQTWTMAHDGSEYLDSLTEGSSTPFDYGYDERGNLRTRVVAAASPSHTTYHVNDKDQITGIDVGNGSSVTQSYAVSYDARYNVQSDGKCSYVYDLEDLPTSVTCGTTTTTVQRDGFGRPARVIATGGETKDVWLVWDNDRVVQERSGSNPSVALRTWYPNGYTDHSSSTSGPGRWEWPARVRQAAPSHRPDRRPS